MSRSLPQPPQRIVIKIGSGVLAEPSGLALDLPQMRWLVGEVAELRAAGHRCVLVSSGAVAAGLMELGLEERPEALASVQALAAIGQARLMQTYRTLFDEVGCVAAQLLLTHQDLDSRLRYRNAKNTLEELLGDRGAMPIVNENDSVAVEELKFGDNDELSAEVAILSDADVLLLLTGAVGLTDSPDGNGELIREVRDVDSVLHLAGPGHGRLSVGGMASKLLAVRTAVEAGIPTWIADGRAPGIVAGVAGGGIVGTYFHAAAASRAPRSPRSESATDSTSTGGAPGRVARVAEP